MPFDGSGNFSRLYSFQQDRDNGIRILSQRVDGEFDNFAGGMNQVFFRNGLVPMTNNLNLGQNYIVGLGAGSVSAPSVRFGDDGSSGLFLNGFNRPALTVANTVRLEANTAGVAVTGNLTQNGQNVWNTGNFNPTFYAPLSGATFTGGISSPLVQVAPNYYSTISATDPIINFDTSDYLQYSRANNQYLFNSGGVQLASISQSGANFYGLLQQGGNPVWHSGNFNPSNYAAFSGSPTFAGTVTAPNVVSTGFISAASEVTATRFRSTSNGDGFGILFGDDAWLGDVNQVATFGVKGNTDAASGFIAFGAVDNRLGVQNNGALQYKGNTVWHSGNLNPSAYATLNSSPTFSGTVSGPSIAAFAPGLGYTTLSTGTGSQPGYIEFRKADGTRAAYIGLSLGSRLAMVTENGFTGFAVSGDLVRNGQGAFANQAQSGLSATMSRGTGAPSGGADGDMYFQYA